MTQNYTYYMSNGHIIVQTGDKHLFIDTDAPFSMSDYPELEFGDSIYKVSNNFMGTSINSLSDFIGAKIHALVGVDILNQYDIIIDPTTNTFSITKDEFPLNGTILPLKILLGTPIFEANIGDATVNLVFDTGAKLSYLISAITRPYISIEEEIDFYPLFGYFNSKVYNVPIKLSDQNITLRAGNLPSLLDTPLIINNLQGVIGTFMLNNYKITYAPRRKKLAIERINDKSICEKKFE